MNPKPTVDSVLDQLAALEPEQRRQVLAALEADREPLSPGYLTWERLRLVEGIVDVGGDAAAETEALYDA